MDRARTIAALIANAVLLAALLYMAVFEVYDTAGRAIFLAAALAPALAVAALWSGPDAEERALMRQARKARLRALIAEAGKTGPS
ncbi:MAG TPA: hypothetical protein DDX54_05615 [Rhodospirillaceae bacterium]|jgi:hypothetical protein|nr:hypothetical protein [Alphaproteobacteria bacterium]HBH26860.1 hypothetical protein [Rhodospirillaceae bacterium]